MASIHRDGSTHGPAGKRHPGLTESCAARINACCLPLDHLIVDVYHQVPVPVCLYHKATESSEALRIHSFTVIPFVDEIIVRWLQL